MDELVSGSLHGDAETGPVGVEAGGCQVGIGAGDPQRLVDGRQSVDLLGAGCGGPTTAARKAAPASLMALSRALPDSPRSSSTIMPPPAERTTCRA
ncbi:hypothetical protein ACQP1W_17500 [Spirillospora sp. CA-255316]